MSMSCLACFPPDRPQKKKTGLAKEENKVNEELSSVSTLSEGIFRTRALNIRGISV